MTKKQFWPLFFLRLQMKIGTIKATFLIIGQFCASSNYNLYLHFRLECAQIPPFHLLQWPKELLFTFSGHEKRTGAKTHLSLLLEYLRAMITNSILSHQCIPSHPQSLFNHLNRPRIDLSRPPMTEDDLR